MNRWTAGLTFAIALLTNACDDPSAVPFVPGQPAFGVTAAAACPASPDFVVHDITTLLQAVATAPSGATIALDGMIEVSGSQVVVTTDELTITCATPGSGLRTRPGAGIDWLLVVFARAVTVRDLAFDASDAQVGALLAYFNPGAGAFAEDARFVHNSLTCGPGQCIFVGADFFAEMRGALVADNALTAARGEIGIQAQGIDGARIERNTVLATDAAGDGIRSNGSVNVSISDNVVTGPWRTGLALIDGVFSSSALRNRLEGQLDGVLMFENAYVQFSENTVSCGRDECLFAAGAERVTITGNNFTSAGSVTGVHMQVGSSGTGISGSRIERNTIVATAPSTGPTFGGIRARDGGDVVIAHNTITGPWSNSLALTDLAASLVEHNTLEGAAEFGAIWGVGVTFVGISMTDNAFRNNQVRGARSGGIFARSACRNTLVGNNLQSTGGAGLILEETTGANAYVGDRDVVIDNGAFDCDGDGVADPNVLTGPGLARRGVDLGRIVATFTPAEGKLR